MEVAKLNEERKRQNLSVAELAKKAQLPKGTIEKVLFGIVKNPRIDTMQAIERALGLSPSIFSEEDYSKGVTDEANIRVNTREYKWHELGVEVFETKGEEYYNTLVQMIEGIINTK